MDREDGFNFRLKKFPKVEIFPYYQLSGAIDILYKNPDLWESASLDIDALPSMVGRIPIFGVFLKKAFKIIKRHKLLKAHFALYPDSYNPRMGIAANLHLWYNLAEDSKEINLMTLEVWEELGENSLDLGY